MLSHSLAIGYHGCDRNLAGRIVAGKTELKPSENAWDWLGHGIYLWEDSPARALRWAEAEAGRAGSKIKSPAVLGAVVDLGNCLNLADTEALTPGKKRPSNLPRSSVLPRAFPLRRIAAQNCKSAVLTAR